MFVTYRPAAFGTLVTELMMWFFRSFSSMTALGFLQIASYEFLCSFEGNS